MRNFHKAAIKIYDTSNIYDCQLNYQWFAEFKNLKWYGPFCDKRYSASEDNFIFQTATDSGNFQGFFFGLWAKKSNSRDEDIYFSYLDRDNNGAGREPYKFYNN